MNALTPSTSNPGLANYEISGPTLLAAQPPALNKPQKKGKDWGRIYQHLESRLSGLRNWRYSRWVFWADLARFTLPFRYKWLIVANRMWRDRPLNNAILDNTATQAMWVCASGLWTGLTNPARPWFKLGIGMSGFEPDQEALAWLADTEERLYSVFAGSNFYTTLSQAFQDVVVFGSAPMIMYEDAEDVIRCYLPCAGEYFLDSGSRLSIDVLYREFTLTVAQIVEMFGLENCPEDIRGLWNAGGGSWSTEFVVCHALEPNSPLAGYGGNTSSIQVVPRAFTYREVYWTKGQGEGGELSRRGFHEAPFMVARWKTVSNDPYGRALSEDAIGDTKQLQLETARKAEFIEKLVRPPMGADPAMKNEPSSILPGHITYCPTEGARKGFWPLFQVEPAALAPMVVDLAEIRERIKETYFVPIFMAISQMEGVQPRNELELSKRDMERLQVLGPFITLFETEFADPAIKRALAIMTRRNLLRPKPKSLQGVPIKIDYISILRLAQRSAETVAAKDFVAFAGALGTAAQAAQLPSPLRILNLDELLRDYGKRGSVDPKVVYTPEQVQQHDQARAKQAQAQQLATAAPQMVDAAKSLSQTPMDGNTALAAMIGGARGGSI